MIPLTFAYRFPNPAATDPADPIRHTAQDTRPGVGTQQPTSLAVVASANPSGQALTYGLAHFPI